MAAIRPSQLTKKSWRIGGGTTIINCTVIAGGLFCFLPIQIIIHSNVFECPCNGLNDNTQQMLPKWKGTTSHIFYSCGRSNHRHHTLLTSMSTHPDSPATVIRTTSDVNFEQAHHIYAVAARITDAIGIFEELCSAIGDHTSSRNKLLEKALFVKKFVIPLFLDTIITITAAAKNLSPISGSKYVHQRNETKRKWEIELSNNTTLTPGEEMIVWHVKAVKHNNKMVDVTPAVKQHRRSTACVSPTDTLDIITLPTPATQRAAKSKEGRV
jgi:hypothetical protein